MKNKEIKWNKNFYNKNWIIKIKYIIILYFFYQIYLFKEKREM